MFTYTFTFTLIYIYIFVCMYTYTCISQLYTYTCTCLLVHTYTCTCLLVHMYTYLYMYIFLLRTYIYINNCIYIIPSQSFQKKRSPGGTRQSPLIRARCMQWVWRHSMTEKKSLTPLRFLKQLAKACNTRWYKKAQKDTSCPKTARPFSIIVIIDITIGS